MGSEQISMMDHGARFRGRAALSGTTVQASIFCVRVQRFGAGGAGGERRDVVERMSYIESALRTGIVEKLRAVGASDCASAHAGLTQRTHSD